jgi:Xaa-Pro aminopeptidase
MMSAAQAAAQISHGAPGEFVADVLAGPNTAEVCAPVAVPGAGRARPGQPVVADISVGADGYRAGTCRTYVNGSSAEVDEIREQLQEIMDAARFGVRHENLFLVTPDGAVELAQAMERTLSPQALAAWSR